MVKAQSQMHLAMVIFAVIIAALVVLYGYRVISGLGSQVDESEYAQFRARLQSDLDAVSPNFGSFRRETYNVPSFISTVCFYAPSRRSAIPDMSCRLLEEYPIIENALQTGRDNVFILGERTETFFLSDIETGECPLRCFEAVAGKVSMRMTGTGNSTFISITG